MNQPIFSSEFIKTMSDYLAVKCADGTCITRKGICEALDIDESFDGAMGAIIKIDIIPGYQIHMGPTGGIGLKDVKPPKRSRVTTAASFPDGFLTDLEQMLDTLCEESEKPVPRWVVAEKMGQPGSATENLISSAVKLDEFKSFDIKNGRYGGVVFAEETVEAGNVVGLDAPLDVSAPLDTSLEDAVVTNPLPISMAELRGRAVAREEDNEQENDGENIGSTT